MADRLDWKQAEAREDIVQRAARCLGEGQLVLFPTETVYGVAALASDAQAVERLFAAKGREGQKPLALALADVGDCRLRFPDLPLMVRRLISRCFPGPVTLVIQPGERSVLADLPEDTRRAILSDRGVGLRVADHAAIRDTIRALGQPLVLSSANRSGLPEAMDGINAMNALGAEAALLVDDGDTKYKKPSTVARVDLHGVEILREGVVTSTRLARLANEVVIFVCTGNTCRSPMAEAICKRMLAEELGCSVEDLPEHGHTIISAGISAGNGMPAAAMARDVVAEFNASLSDHASHGLTPQWANLSDRILVMTEDHRQAILDQWPHLQDKVRRLARDSDINDPIGGTMETYRDCANQISFHLRDLLAEMRAARAAVAR